LSPVPAGRFFESELYKVQNINLLKFIIEKIKKSLGDSKIKRLSLHPLLTSSCSKKVELCSQMCEYFVKKVF
jgi:hypothetical protein